MMTLLCGFFIMMFALSTIDERKFNQAKKEIAKEFGGKYDQPKSEELKSLITQVVQEAGIGNKTLIKSDDSSVIVTFQSTLFFDTLSADVKPEGKVVLDQLIGAIANRQLLNKTDYRIVVEGHTDSRPILGGNYPSNWELSGARASRVVRMFLNRGFAPDHMTAIAYGDTRPAYPSRSPAGEWDEQALSKNRRVVLRILAPNASTVPLAQPQIITTPPRSTAVIVPQSPSAATANAATTAH
jgi:chemotaxis protein MotB